MLAQWISETQVLVSWSRTSIIFNSFFKKHEINHLLTSPNNPRRNGIVEKVNRTIGEILRLYRGRNIADLRNAIHARLNNTWNRATNQISSQHHENKHFKSKETGLNNPKVSIKIKPGETVFIKTHSADKIDPIWEESVVVSDIGKDKNYIKVKQNKGTKTINTYNVRREAGCSDSHHMTWWVKYFIFDELRHY